MSLDSANTTNSKPVADRRSELLSILLKDMTCEIQPDGSKVYLYKGKPLMQVAPEITVAAKTDATGRVQISATQLIRTFS